LLVGIGEAEIDQLERAVEVDQQVLGLQVAVHDPQLVEVLDPCDQLSEELAGLVLLEPFLFDDEFEEFALGDILHD
jgi:hypothetical protein